MFFLPQGKSNIVQLVRIESVEQLLLKNNSIFLFALRLLIVKMKIRVSVFFCELVMATCLLMTTVTAKPFKHYGRCRVDNKNAFCVRSEDCWENISTGEIAGRTKCSSTVVSDLVCCQPERNNAVTSSNIKMILPDPPYCGQLVEDLIYGGEKASITDYPWMALLLYTLDDINFVYRCGGSLISKRWVVTAAHCNSKTGYRLARVRLGEWDTRTNPDCQYFKHEQVCSPAHQDVDIIAIIVHESYDTSQRTVGSDIALLKLASDVTYTDFVKPICLPDATDAEDHDYADVVMDIAGWGNTETTYYGSSVKQKTFLSVWSKDNCKSFIGDASRQQLCAGGNSNSSSCHGDSGGPLIFRNNNKIGSKSYYLTGIISLGAHNCSTRGQPVVFTKVENYVNWITQKVLLNDLIK